MELTTSKLERVFLKSNMMESLVCIQFVFVVNPLSSTVSIYIEYYFMILGLIWCNFILLSEVCLSFIPYIFNRYSVFSFCK